MRLETFEFTWPPGTLVFLIQSNNASSFAPCPCKPLNISSTLNSTLGQLQFMGSYNCLFGAAPYGSPVLLSQINQTTFYLLAVNTAIVSNVLNATQLPVLMQQALTGFSITSSRVFFGICGVARMALGNSAIRSNSSLGLSQFFDTRNVMGVNADIAAFLMYTAIILLVRSNCSFFLILYRRSKRWRC